MTKLNRIKDVAGLLNNLGYLSNNLGDIEKALEYYHHSIIIKEELGDKQGLCNTIHNVALIHKNQKNISDAMEYYNRALKLGREIDYQLGVSANLSSIAQLYQMEGYDLQYQGDSAAALELFNKGHKYLLRSFVIADSIGFAQGAGIALNQLGDHLYLIGKRNEAMFHYYNALERFREIESIEWLCNIHMTIGQKYLGIPNNDSALFHTMRAYQIAKKTGFPRLIDGASMVAYQLYHRLGDFEKALSMYEEHIDMRDSLVNETNQKASIRQQTKYEFEKAEILEKQEQSDRERAEREAVQRRDNLQYSIIFIAILLVFGAVAGVGFINVSPRVAEGLIFFSFLILFEFLLALADPMVEEWSSGAPGYKLLFNAGLAAFIFPLHAYFERFLKRRLIKIGK